MPKAKDIDISQVKIESSIPVPRKEDSLAAKLREIFTRMRPGDSVLLPLTRNSLGWTMQSMREEGFKFVTATEGAGIRVWRTK